MICLNYYSILGVHTIVGWTGACVYIFKIPYMILWGHMWHFFVILDYVLKWRHNVDTIYTKIGQVSI